MTGRSFRPFSDWPLQTPVLRALFQELETERVPHAMMFVGTTAVTRMFAEFFAKTLLCTGQGAPCDACPSCHQMDAGNHPDFISVTTEDGGSVKAAQIEEIQSRLKLRGHGKGRIVYMIEGMDKLTPVAANRLLKTLEEPLSSTIALLTAENDGRVLSTIRSRAFLYRVGSGEAAFDDPLPDSLTRSPNEQNLSFAGLLKPVIQWTHHTFQKRQGALSLAAELVKETESYELSDVLHVLIVWLRDLMHYRLEEYESLVCQEFIQEVKAQAATVEISQILRVIEIVIDAKRRTLSHVGARLNVEQMCIRIREVI
ncbi:hypothetical protein JZ785_17125 [Alicyclobacillus curvatus]|jgi:DNA polymerase III subunit delta'|nr:hypothetical protein JZ785_17125 [Alicyclobacillus curvatus]